MSPKLRVPLYASTFAGFEAGNHVSGKDFVTIGSLAKGGLSNAWGCGLARLSARDMAAYPFLVSDLEASIATISQRIGISGGTNDDLSEYFGLDEYSQPPISLDVLHTNLLQHYLKHRQKINKHGMKLGRSRVAVLSQDMASREHCHLSGNCLWGCKWHSTYSSNDELPQLRRHNNFSERSGFVVDGLTQYDGYWGVEGDSRLSGRQTLTAHQVILAAGTLATTRLVLKTLKYKHPVSMQSCPTAAFLLWLPRRLGLQRAPGFGLGQLSFVLDLANNITAFGSTFATTGITMSEFARYLPLSRRYAIDLLRGLLSTCVVGNLFLPGQFTQAEVQLREDMSLCVSGAYHADVDSLMKASAKVLRKAYRHMGAILLPGSFRIGRPGSDIHYAATLPMRASPRIGETSKFGEVKGLDGVYVVDGACLPTLSEKSHTLTLMANADRIGRQLAAI